MNAIVAAIVILSICVLCLLIAFLALARQVGVLLERVWPIGALVTDSGPKVGESAPQVRVQSLTGGFVEIGFSSERSKLLFFVSPSCPICKKLLPVLKAVKTSEKEWLDIILASDGDAAQHSRFINSAKLQPFAYVVSSELGVTYRVARLPFGVLIDGTGTIRSKGLVNSREQLESLFNAMEMNTSSVQSFLRHAPPLSSKAV
jgi:methylamine dehydrogenase accessory protein MauD